jgi:hypothetical protein
MAYSWEVGRDLGEWNVAMFVERWGLAVEGLRIHLVQFVLLLVLR